MLYESFRVKCIGGVEDRLAFLNNERSLAMVKYGRGKQADPRMMMLLVVPVEEFNREGASICKGSKAIWKAGPVLQGFELAF